MAKGKEEKGGKTSATAKKAVAAKPAAKAPASAKAPAKKPVSATKNTGAKQDAAKGPSKSPATQETPRASERFDVKALQGNLPHLEVKLLDQIIGKLEEMRSESSEIVNNHMRSDLQPREESSDVGDDLDQASNERDREFNLIMHQRHLRRLHQIEEAFERMEDGSYGLCEGTDEPINPRRLLIMPLARYSLEYQEQQEKMLGRDMNSGYMGDSAESFDTEE